MSAAEVDRYLLALPDENRRCLESLRQTLRHRLGPEVDECISYGLPAMRLGGNVVAGFGAFSSHLSYFPHSGSVLHQLDVELGDRSRTKSALHFTAEDPLPAELIDRLVTVRLNEIATRGR